MPANGLHVFGLMKGTHMGSSRKTLMGLLVAMIVCPAGTSTGIREKYSRSMRNRKETAQMAPYRSAS